MGYGMKRLIYIESVVLVSLLLVVGVTAHQRNHVWKDDLSLWSDAIKKSPGKARPHDYMGIAKYKSRLIDDAIKHHKQKRALPGSDLRTIRVLHDPSTALCRARSFQYSPNRGSRT